MEDDEYPPGRDSESDDEFTYYNAKEALYRGNTLAKHGLLGANQGAVKVIGIPDACDPGRFDAHHMPPDGPRYA